MREPLASLLESGLVELGIRPDSAQIGGLLKLAKLVERWSQRMNLSGHRDAESIIRRLILDAAALHTVLPRFDSLADLGSGAGFPGIPIAVLAPSCSVLLVEARERRHHFQREAVRKLGLQNVRALRGRIEKVDPVPSRGVIAQAVGPPVQVMEWMAAWVSDGGFAAIPGGAEPFHVEDQPGWTDVRVLEYQVPLDGPRRTVWLGRRRGSGLDRREL